eukprot:CAMPEP_0206442562 /NCGR_PEP_ID=MMETSP0324_2-20121206/13890_1 /ASSEMBLY_ACC=CAM_ASM_000836 /TAXON_ID=2866 /ORGANISM="Crypthecodinium cohnii, Strain Seligo" /LENGTH=566 /DNA_ID=CAMNT_0053910417 /DNA_START=39 /DNA_END=1738 /DNA_ORIENTATION=-
METANAASRTAGGAAARTHAEPLISSRYDCSSAADHENGEVEVVEVAASRWGSSRWVVLFGGMLLELCGGSIYITGLYSSDLRNRFFPGDGGQEQIEQLVFACNLGNWLPVSGFFNDSRWGGSRNCAVIASGLTLLGYLGVSGWSSGKVQMDYWQIWLCWFLWGHGSGWFDNAAMTATVRNFPAQRGRAVATMKAFYGLSGSILTQVYNVFFFRETTSFLLFLAIALAGLGACFSNLMFLVPTAMALDNRDKPGRRLDQALVLVVVLALVLMGVSIVRSGTTDPDHSSDISIVGFVAVLGTLVMLMLIAVQGSREVKLDGGVNRFASTNTVAVAGAGLSSPLTTALRTLEYWLLFLVTFVGMGSGIVVLNNAGQMMDAVGGTEQATALLVSVISIANCFGRITYGIVPDLVHTTVPRPIFVPINLTVMALGQLLLTISTSASTYAGGIVAGFAYGGFWTLMPTLVVEIFGGKSFATLYNFMSLAVSSASLIFSTLMAGSLYDQQAKLHPGLKQGSCSGPECYRTTCYIMVGACAVGVAASFILVKKMRDGPPALLRTRADATSDQA